jgi:hypothetical protein
MAWSTPQVPVPGTAITSAWAAQTVVDNLNWLRAMTGQASPPGSGYVAESSSVGMTAWVQMVRRNGDQMANDLMVTRSLLGHAEQGYLFLGNSTANFFGFDGAKHVFQTPGISIDNDVTISRRAAPTTGYIVLGSGGPGHFFGWDGTNHVINGSAVWFDGNATNRVTTPTIADANVTTAKLADGAVTTPKLANLAVTAAKIASDVAVVPSGVIALWKTATPPAGWVIDTDFQTRVPIGAGSGFALGATGGAPTHAHDIAHAHPQTTTSAALVPGGAVQGGGAASADPAGHLHNYTAPAHGAGTTFSAAGSSLPPYLVSHFIRKT